MEGNISIIKSISGTETELIHNTLKVSKNETEHIYQDENLILLAYFYLTLVFLFFAGAILYTLCNQLHEKYFLARKNCKIIPINKGYGTFDNCTTDLSSQSTSKESVCDSYSESDLDSFKKEIEIKLDEVIIRDRCNDKIFITDCEIKQEKNNTYIEFNEQ